jgi:hypothetical protein
VGFDMSSYSKTEQMGRAANSFNLASEEVERCINQMDAIIARLDRMIGHLDEVPAPTPSGADINYLKDAKNY